MDVKNIIVGVATLAGVIVTSICTSYVVTSMAYQEGRRDAYQECATMIKYNVLDEKERAEADSWDKEVESL